VYQPRGVGLMHTRPKPSEPNYTHADESGRKPKQRQKQRFCCEFAVTVSWQKLPLSVGLPSCRTPVVRPAAPPPPRQLATGDLVR